MKVNFPEVPRGGEREVMGPRMRSRGYIDSPHKIYAGNLGWTVTSENLRNAFSAQPGILSAKVIFERDTGRSRGFGFVSFASAEEAQAAMEAMNGVVQISSFSICDNLHYVIRCLLVIKELFECVLVM